MQQTIEYIINNVSLCAWIQNYYFIDSDHELSVEEIEWLLRKENDEALLDYCETEEDEEERSNSYIQWRFENEDDWRTVP